MSVLNRTPINTNYLQPTKFILTLDRAPATQFFCQTANIPGVSLGSITYNTPRLDFPIIGNKLTYSDFTIKFNINEDLQSWKDIYTWFLSIASPEGTEQSNPLTNLTSKRSSLANYSDATLTVLSSLNNPLLNVRFINMFPVSLSDIQFDTASSADNILTADATFRYEFFKFN